MLKKYFLVALIAFSLVATSLISCKNDADDEDDTTETTTEAAARTVAATYTVDETMRVNLEETMIAALEQMGLSNATSEEKKSLTIAYTTDNTVDITLPGIAYEAMGMTMPSFTIHNVTVSTTDNDTYTFTLGEFSEKAMRVGGTTEEDIADVKGESVSGTLVKSTGKISITAVYTFSNMPYSCNDVFTTASTSAKSVRSVAAVSSTTSVSDCYGTWTGKWKVLGIDFQTTVKFDANTVSYQSSKKSGSYKYVAWYTDKSGNWICCASNKAGEANLASAAVIATFKGDTCYFWVRAMDLFSKPAELTKQ